MLDTIIKSTTGESFTLSNTLIILGTTIILGLVISLVYMVTHRKSGYSGSFPGTLIMLPVIIAIIILLVGNNIARAFSLAGAFSIIRFRSEPGNPRDISYVFFTLAVGLASGMGYVSYAAIFTVVLGLVLIVLDLVKFGEGNSNSMDLKITIPENLNYDNVFDDILNKYSNDWNLKKVKTKEFGALFELDYLVSLKKDINTKKFIDELRCKNGNLNIILTNNKYLEEK